MRLPLRPCLCAAALLPVFGALHYFAYWLRFDGNLAAIHWSLFSDTVFWAIGFKVVCFWRFRVYQSWSRYATFHDLTAIAKAASAASILVLLVNYLLVPGNATPRSVFLLDWGLTVVAVGGLRSTARFLLESDLSAAFSTRRTPVLIVGTNDSGEALLRAIRRNTKLAYRVAGFVSEDPQTLHSHIGGVPVLGLLEDTCSLAESRHVSEVLIAAGELSGAKVRRLVEDGKRSGLTVKVLPSYDQLLRGNIDLRPRQVSIEDILRRDPVQLDMQALHGWIDGRSLLVTGAAGSIGSEICRQLLQFSPRRLVALDRSENGQFFLERELRSICGDIDVRVAVADVRDATRIRNIFREHQPEIVFHAAAYKHVPLMEAQPGEAVKNITLATRILADIADEEGVDSFVMISTDKAVNPTSIMGTCKRVAELYVQCLAEKSDCRFVTVRFGNVLDSVGSVIPIFREQIAHGGPITVTHPDMQRFFMTIPEASQLVIQAGAMGHGGEVFVLDMGDPVRIVDLATDLISLSGLRVGEDVAISFVGMRPGEKLFEELNVDGERHLSTNHPKIMVAKGHHPPFHQITASLDRLERAADGPSATLRAILKSLVPQHRASGLRQAERRAA